MAVFPFSRERGRQFDTVVVALQQHSSNTGSSAEVSVDLEGRMMIGEGGRF